MRKWASLTRRRRSSTPAPSRWCRGGPAQRRQVDAGQPDHRPAPAVVEDVPGVTRDRGAVRRTVERPQLHRRRHGGWSRTPRTGRPPSPPRPRSRSPPPTSCLFVVDTTVGATDVDEGRRADAARSAKPVILVANKVDNAATEIEAPRCGPLRPRQPFPGLPRCTGAAPVTCSTRYSPRCRPRLRWARADRAARPGGARRPAQRRQVQPAQPADEEERAVVDSVAGYDRRPGGQPGRTSGGETWQLGPRAAPQRSGTGQRQRVLREPSYQRRIEAAEVSIVLLERERIDQRAGPADPVHGDRLRPGPVLAFTSGTGRRGPPVLPGQGDRPGTARPHLSCVRSGE